MLDPDVTLILSHLARELTGRDVIRGIVTYGDPDYGPVIRLVVDLSAREALELWLKLVKLIPYARYGVVIGVRWLGEDNISRDELVDYVIKIMVEGGLRTIALEPLDVVRELRGEQDRR
jgi:alkanesulfonate monooxygenase SsuD/methylene tetrahydromethanopterin reductase-like flavin-dependent oxidoreductase (luciferase family)